MIRAADRPGEGRDLYPFPSMRLPLALVLSSAVIGGIAAFSALCAALGTRLPIRTPAVLLGAAVALAATGAAFVMLVRKADLTYFQGAAGIAVLTAAGVVLLLAAGYQMAAYVRLPVDLLSWAESSFVNDILKFRLGVPIYTLPADNNSYPYMPGAPILTYLISALVGRADSIPFYRAIQFCYVLLAAILAASLADSLAHKFLSKEEYRHRPLWIAAWLPLLFLASIDSHFNAFNHSLHNDGLALLVSVMAFWVMVRHSLGPKRWHLVAMVCLPAVGFLVKQSLLVWIGIFPIYLLAAGKASRKQALFVLLASGTLAGGTIVLCYALWGDNFVWWIFRALADKQVSPARSLLHLLAAGGYAALGLFGGWVLVLRRPIKDALTLWFVWLFLFGLEAYTSGIGWNVNHLGPGVVLATVWFLVAVAKFWPSAAGRQPWWQCGAQEVVAAASVLLLFVGILGPVRLPGNPIPADFSRYVADIEREFEGLPAARVLMDSGTWVYLEERVVMKDRAWAVSLHSGENQPVNHAMLRATIDRIRNRTYDKILARQLDTAESLYDYHDRGSGVKAAILANYHVVRRIPGVAGIDIWWPKDLIAEILILEPNQ